MLARDRRALSPPRRQSQELSKLMREDLKKWNAVATQAGIKPE
jgi:hypothetical protein